MHILFLHQTTGTLVALNYPGKSDSEEKLYDYQ